MSKMDAFPEVIQRLGDEIQRSRHVTEALRASNRPASEFSSEVHQSERAHRETIDAALAYWIRQGKWRESESLPVEMLLPRLESAHFCARLLSQGGFWFDRSHEDLLRWLLIEQWPYWGLARWKEVLVEAP